MKKITHEVIYVGTEYYYKSNSLIGILYTTGWERCDWGRVSIWLEKGEKVNIRPATKRQMKLVEAFYKTGCIHDALERTEW
jgi:hypothetical protein